MNRRLVKLSYLSERVYNTFNHDPWKDGTKTEEDFWKKIFGEEFFQKIVLTSKNLRYYMKKQPVHQLQLPYFVQNIYRVPLQKREVPFMNIADIENFLCGWVDQTVSQLSLCNKQYHIRKEFYEQVVKDLEQRLEAVYSRVLIAEMNIFLREKKLLGENPSEKYQFFLNEYLNKTAYVDKVMEWYPALHRALINECFYFYMFYQQFIKCYFASEQKIKKYFNISESSSILCAKVGNSDLHHQGSSVLVLEFTKGERLVYKPRTGANEIVFYQALNYFYKQCGLEVREYKVLDQTESCWCEYLEQLECSNANQVKDYYQRIGILLFTAFAFGTGDLHTENLIVCGEFPMVVDLEVLTKQNVYHARPLEWKVQSSVLGIGILPIYHWGKSGKGIPVGVLGVVKGSYKMPFQVRVVNNRKRVDMCIQYTSYFRQLHTGNASCKGVEADFYAYRDEIVKGYRAAYDHALYKKKEIWSMINSTAKYVKNRVLYEDTQKYAMLIHSSFHPDFMLDAADREIYLEKIREGRKKKKDGVVQAEIQAMMRRDIPLFYQNAQERVVRCEGKIVDEGLDLSPLEMIKKNIFKLSVQDKNWQIYLLDLLLELYQMNTDNLINTEMGESVRSESGSESYLDIIEYVRKIQIQIENMLTNAEGDIGWLEKKVIGKCWTFEENNEYFYSGTAGIFFLYHCLKLTDPMQTSPKVLDALEKRLFRYTMETRDAKAGGQKKVGIFEGEFSIVYAYLLVYGLTGNFRYLELAKIHADCVQCYVQECACCDLLEGKAGSIMGNLLLYEATGELKYLDHARETAWQVAEAGVRTGQGMAWPSVHGGKALLGVSHGNAGIAWMFSRMYFHTREEWYQTMAAKAVHFENANYDMERRDWKDFRTGQPIHRQQISWCHGAGGILLSRKNIMKNCTDQELLSVCKEDIRKNIGRITENKMRKGMSLCHGTVGNYEILRACQGCAGEAMRPLEIGRMLLQEKMAPGFMAGLGGVCYGYLREIYTDLPNVLNLEVSYLRNKVKREQNKD